MKSIINFRPAVSHLVFSLLFTALLYVICNALNFDKIVKWFYLDDQIDYAGLIAFLVFGFSLFLAFFILFAHRWSIKPLAIMLVLLSAAATYFIAKYDVAIDRSMVMNTFYTDATEASGLLSVSMIPYLIFLVIVPIAVIARVEITFQRAARYLAASLAVFFLAISIGVGALYLEYNAIHRAGNLSNKYIVHSLVPVNIIRSVASVMQKSITEYNRKNRKAVVITGEITSQEDLVVVLAIGESSRQKSFSLYGYDKKNTNPVLSKEKSLHVLNGIARIGSTLLALPEILEKNDIKLTALTSKLGIETACYVNYTLYDNCDAVGEVKVSDCAHGGTCYDEDVIPLLENNLKSYQSGYRFIVLHLGGGSHGPTYRDRYPPEFQRFEPQCLEADVVSHCTLEQLYNSYDNTILYVDHVLGQAIAKLDQSQVPYVFIYLSDHGESLMENDRIFHGMPPGIDLPPEQAQVPLIIKSSVPLSIVPREEYGQQDVFDSVLELFSIETELIDKGGAFINKETIKN